MVLPTLPMYARSCWMDCKILTEFSLPLFICHLIPSETISNQSSFHTLPIPALFGLTFLAALMDVHPPEGGNNRFWSIPKHFLPTTTKTNLFCWSIYPLVINIFTACLINKSSYISKGGPFTVANCYITKKSSLWNSASKFCAATWHRPIRKVMKALNVGYQ